VEDDVVEPKKTKIKTCFHRVEVKFNYLKRFTCLNPEPYTGQEGAELQPQP
jgi:hypothetical protein